MRLYIKRIREFSQSTIGEYSLFDDNGKSLSSGYTLEPSGPDTIEANQDKRIPEGKYNTIWEASSMSGNKYFNSKLPTLYNTNVPKSRKIKIHIGNYGSDTLGCILLGRGWSGKNYINDSKKAVIETLNWVKDQEFEVEIENNIDNTL